MHWNFWNFNDVHIHLLEPFVDAVFTKAMSTCRLQWIPQNKETNWTVVLFVSDDEIKVISLLPTGKSLSGSKASGTDGRWMAGLVGILIETRRQRSLWRHFLYYVQYTVLLEPLLCTCILAIVSLSWKHKARLSSIILGL